MKVYVTKRQPFPDYLKNPPMHYLTVKGMAEAHPIVPVPLFLSHSPHINTHNTSIQVPKCHCYQHTRSHTKLLFRPQSSLYQPSFPPHLKSTPPKLPLPLSLLPAHSNTQKTTIQGPIVHVSAFLSPSPHTNTPKTTIHAPNCP